MQEAAASATSPSPYAGIAPSVAGTLVLVVAADILILSSARPGIGWFAFAAGLAAVIAATAVRRSTPAALTAAAVGTAAALPLVEAVSIAGSLAALAGLCAASLIAAGLLPRSLDAIPGVIVRFVPLLPLRLVMDASAAFGKGSGSAWAMGVGRRLLVWVVPLVFVAIFLGLFLAANPVMDFLAEISLGSLALPQPFRIAFWLVFAAAIWALVRPRLAAFTPAAAGGRPSRVPAAAESTLFGRAAITRSLVVFNAIFAVQTLMDLAYLWGGAALPAGVTYADFAHRGAAPLIVTALLAAGFVLAAMRPGGPGIGSPLIRVLVYAWIAQNVLLCLSAMFRLNLYVAAYTLTEFRVLAGIWMVLVAVGLVLIVLRIALGRSNSWLVAANMASVAVVLYASAWIDFPALVARFNVTHSQEISGEGVPLDVGYFRHLGPTAIPALDAFISAVPESETARQVRTELVARFELEATADWRGWTFRDVRLAAYLDRAVATDDTTP